MPPPLSPELLTGSSWDRVGLGGCLVKLKDSSSVHRLNDAPIRMWVSLGSIPALGGDREGEASDSGTAALQGTVSTWLDPLEEAEDGEARSREPAAWRWVTSLPTGEEPEVSAGERAPRGHPPSAGSRGCKLLALAASQMLCDPGNSLLFSGLQWPHLSKDRVSLDHF